MKRLYDHINTGTWVSVLVILWLVDCTLSLTCWQCIADNCEQPPDSNYKATKKYCKEGQKCQKVYFEMFSTTDNRKYVSTVRGCAADCQSKNDHENCSRELYTTRGCIKRTCCSDQDLCNSSHRVASHRTLNGISIVLLCVFTVILAHLMVNT
ncbi:hypothetical protein ScPMuIL_016450 [Solemya velum]